MGKRAEVQRKMAEQHIAEVDSLIKNLRYEIKTAHLYDRGFALIGISTVSRMLRNLEDLKKRFLEGLTQEG